MSEQDLDVAIYAMASGMILLTSLVGAACAGWSVVRLMQGARP